jgi:hypothetical protein
MELPYLTFLETSTTLLALFLGIVIFYGLVKVFNKTVKFLTVLKFVLLYEICAVLIYSIIYPDPHLVQSLKFSIIKLLSLSIILFLLFYFVTRKHFLIGWKKSLAIFLLMTFIVFPLISYFKLKIEVKLIELPIFAKETAKINEYFQKYGLFSIFSKSKIFPPPPGELQFKILERIESALFSWPIDTLIHILFRMQKG